MEIRLKQHKAEQMAKVAAKEVERSAKEQASKERRRRKKKGSAEGDATGEGGDEGEGESEADTDADTDDESGGDDPEEKMDESEQLNVGTKMNANRNGGAKMSVRNLRIREDTAKYLLNLDVNSAYYDPKTRSMREAPLPADELSKFNFVPYNQEKQSGDTRNLAALQLYEYEAYDKGQSLHLNADPTSIELMNRVYREKKESLKSNKVNRVLEKYGGAEHLEQPPAELLFAQTEEYVEYARDGSVRTGKERVVAKSKYEEDVHAHNHACIWGSFFDLQTFRWGYADDHGTTRNAYGTGEAGRRARLLAQANASSAASMQQHQYMRQQEQQQQGGGGVGGGGSSAPPPQQMFGGGEVLDGAELDPELVRRHMREEKKRQQEGAVDERKRKYNSMAPAETSAEQMEAYHRAKMRADDPMANMAADDAETDDEA